MTIPMISIPLFGSVGMTEWLVIGLVIFLFFGAAKLPKLGKGLGEGIRNFKKGITGQVTDEDDSPGDSEDKKNKPESSAIEKDSK